MYCTRTQVPRHCAAISLQGMERFAPAVDFPWHAANFQLNVVWLESGGEIATVFLDGVGRLVFAAEKRDGEGASLG